MPRRPGITSSSADRARWARLNDPDYEPPEPRQLPPPAPEGPIARERRRLGERVASQREIITQVRTAQAEAARGLAAAPDAALAEGTVRAALREIDSLISGYAGRLDTAAQETLAGIERLYAQPDEDPVAKTNRLMQSTSISADARALGTGIERENLIANEARRALDHGDPMLGQDLVQVAERQHVMVDAATRSAVAAAYDQMPHRVARRDAIATVNKFLNEERAALARTRANAQAAGGRQDGDAVQASIDAKLADHAIGRQSGA